MARFPSIDETGAFEAPEVQSKIKELVTGTTDGITVDTSVGTRVFVGDTMIYGDTGLRDIRSLYLGSPSDANIQVLELLRYGRTVRLYGTIANDAAISELTQINLFSAPYGFRTGGYWTRGAGRDLLLGAPGDTRTMRLQTESGRTFGQLGGSVVMFEMEWVTPNPWPTSLPGDPS